MYISASTILYHDKDGYPVKMGQIVSFTEQWCLSHPDWDESEKWNNMDKLFQIIAIDDESGELGILEITDKSGEWVDYRPNYATPVQWEWNYPKYSAI